jgi:hypothetical protein
MSNEEIRQIAEKLDGDTEEVVETLTALEQSLQTEQYILLDCTSRKQDNRHQIFAVAQGVEFDSMNMEIRIKRSRNFFVAFEPPGEWSWKPRIVQKTDIVLTNDFEYEKGGIIPDTAAIPYSILIDGKEYGIPEETIFRVKAYIGIEEIIQIGEEQDLFMDNILAGCKYLGYPEEIMQTAYYQSLVEYMAEQIEFGLQALARGELYGLGTIKEANDFAQSYGLQKALQEELKKYKITKEPEEEAE